MHWYLPVYIGHIVFLSCTCRSWCYNVSVRTTINPRHVPVLDLPNLKSICSLLDYPRTDREMAATVFDFYSDEPIRVPLKYRYYHMVNSRSDQSHGQKNVASSPNISMFTQLKLLVLGSPGFDLPNFCSLWPTGNYISSSESFKTS